MGGKLAGTALKVTVTAGAMTALLYHKVTSKRTKSRRVKWGWTYQEAKDAAVAAPRQQGGPMSSRFLKTEVGFMWHKMQCVQFHSLRLTRTVMEPPPPTSAHSVAPERKPVAGQQSLPIPGFPTVPGNR